MRIRLPRLKYGRPAPLTTSQKAALVVAEAGLAKVEPLVLVATWPSLAVWTWAYANPYRWNAYHQINGVGEFVFDDFMTGEARQYAPDGGQHPMFIVGVDANGVEVTPRSNVVVPDDAMRPGPLLVAGSDAVATWTWESPNPTSWQVWNKINGVGDWLLLDTLAGTTRIYAPDGGQHPLFIVGVNGSGAETTTRSNVLVPDTYEGGGLAPVALDLHPFGGLSWTWAFVEPAFWHIEASADGGVTWTFDQAVAGTLRSCFPERSYLLRRIAAGDAGGYRISKWSNAVWPNVLRVVVLAPTYPSLATWEWSGEEPYRWNAYHQINGVGDFVYDDFMTGNARQYAPDGGQHPMYIVGVDAEGREVTRRSNVVIPDNALLPGPTLVATYPSLATWTWSGTNPARWVAWHQINGVGDFVEDDWTAGTNRQYAPDGGQHPMYIVGCNEDGTPVTLPSNTVVPDDAPAPAQPNAVLNVTGWFYFEGASSPPACDIQIYWSDYVHGTFPVAELEIWLDRNYSNTFVLIGTVPSNLAGPDATYIVENATEGEESFKFKMRYKHGTTLGPWSNVVDVGVSV